jgi:hypothetical protein
MPNPETLGHNELNCEELRVSFSRSGCEAPLRQRRARYGRESSTLRHAPGASTPTIQHAGTIYAPQVGGSLT